MEVTVDIGKDIDNTLKKVSRITGEPLDAIASEALAIGSKVLLRKAKKDEEVQENPEIDWEKLAQYIRESYTVGLQNSEVLAEILSMVFDKDKSQFGAFDVETALKFSRKIAVKSLQRAETS
jgi:hypothetical protein